MNNKIELRPCPFCVGKYYCDTEGNIYNSKGRRIKPYDNGYGYLIVDIRIMGKRKHIKVHRIIATAFIPNPHLLPEVNHKDEDKHNNAVENLEWCTSSYNKTYGKGRTSRAEGMRKVWANRRVK